MLLAVVVSRSLARNTRISGGLCGSPECDSASVGKGLLASLLLVWGSSRFL